MVSRAATQVRLVGLDAGRWPGPISTGQTLAGPERWTQRAHLEVDFEAACIVDVVTSALSRSVDSG